MSVDNAFLCFELLKFIIFDWYWSREKICFFAYYGGWVCTHILPIQMKWHHYHYQNYWNSKYFEFSIYAKFVSLCEKLKNFIFSPYPLHIFLHSCVSSYAFCGSFHPLAQIFNFDFNRIHKFQSNNINFNRHTHSIYFYIEIVNDFMLFVVDISLNDQNEK